MFLKAIELLEYINELWSLIAAMQLDPVPETVLVIIFMEGLLNGVSRAEVFRDLPHLLCGCCEEVCLTIRQTVIIIMV